MDRDGVVDGAIHSASRHALHHCVPVPHPYRVHVINVLAIRRCNRANHARLVRKQFIIAPRVSAASVVRRSQTSELDAKHRRLDAIHASIPANGGMEILRRLAVVPQHLHLRPQLRIVGRHRPSFAEGTKVLAWIKAEASGSPNAASFATLVLGAMRLTSILNHRRPVPPPQRLNCVHVRRLPEQMHRHDRLGANPNRRLKLSRVHGVGFLVDIDEYRPGAACANRFGGRHKTVGNRYDLISWPHAKRQQTQPERIGPVADTQRMPGLTKRRKFGFESGDKWPARKGAGLGHLPKRIHEFSHQRLVLRAQIQKWYLNVHKTPRLLPDRLSTRAGLPATTAPSGTSLVTTAPAPTVALAPMVTPHRMVAPEPTDAPRLTVVEMHFQSASDCRLPSALVARGKRSLMKVTPCPIKTSSSTVTPSQMNVWVEILQRLPIRAPFWISTKLPIFTSSPISQPYKFVNANILTRSPSFTSGAMR